MTVLEGNDFSWTVLFVDDGSTDGTLTKLKEIHASDSRFIAISFSRNFGKDIAIAAGFRYARGDAVMLMDADLQHPPEVIPTFIERWREGSRSSSASARAATPTASSASSLRALPRHLPPHRQTRLPVGVVDFLLLDRKAVDAINRLGERTRFSKGLYAWIGFPSAVVPFASPTA